MHFRYRSIISGFYISLVLNETYGRTLAGLVAFYTNRALRIYIPYWTVLLVFIGLSVLGLTPSQPITGDLIISPTTIFTIADNVLLLPPAFISMIAFNIQSDLWFRQMYTVGLELIFYS